VWTFINVSARTVQDVVVVRCAYNDARRFCNVYQQMRIGNTKSMSKLIYKMTYAKQGEKSGATLSTELIRTQRPPRNHSDGYAWNYPRTPQCANQYEKPFLFRETYKRNRSYFKKPTNYIFQETYKLKENTREPTNETKWVIWWRETKNTHTSITGNKLRKKPPITVGDNICPMVELFLTVNSFRLCSTKYKYW